MGRDAKCCTEFLPGKDKKEGMTLRTGQAEEIKFLGMKEDGSMLADSTSRRKLSHQTLSWTEAITTWS